MIFHKLKKLKQTVYLLIITAGILSLLYLAGCGGGFHSDSDTADHFLDPLFNKDTTNESTRDTAQ